ncbi:MAG: dephospho-CoA kinase [Lachnospiraceae bacterium]|nr:dephospho-CoA kinase [Lachnospiraceae bacterium]
MKILGLTGGVGSGKSKVLNELREKYDAYIIEADKLAHQLMLPGETIYKEIVKEFGCDILSEKSPYYIDRNILGDIVFNNKEKLNKLNSITHPLVKQKIIELINERKFTGDTKLFVIEAALLIEAGYKEICDEIWYIWVDKEERIKRLMDSRGYTREKCLSIFENQQEDSFYKKYSDHIINNQNSFKNTALQIKDLLNML